MNWSELRQRWLAPFPALFPSFACCRAGMMMIDAAPALPRYFGSSIALACMAVFS
jgi:hypothetical protein